MLLGIDIGTSACKVACFTLDGQIVASKSASYPVHHKGAGWVEQNPQDWWEGVCKALQSMIREEQLNPQDIQGIGIDGQSWSAVAVDQEGEVLCNTPIWMDTRAKNICDELNARIGEEKIFRLAGNSLKPAYTTAKILWYQKHLPEVHKKIYKILQSNSFIAYRLTGAITQDVSQSYGMHCFDITHGCWDNSMCELLGIDPNFLPDIVPCHQIVGTVTALAAEQTGLVKGTPVVAGGLDAACGTLGAGVIHPGETQEQGGQAGGMSICVDTPVADPRLILSHHVVPGKWLLQGGTTGGGGVMRWFEQEFGDYERSTSRKGGKSSFALLDDLAGQIPAGSDGLLFLPYMAGERSPIWDARAKGVYFGIDFQKTKGHFVRASLEGTAYALKHNLDVAKEKGAVVQELRAMGGAANSVLWTQIKADITGKSIIVPSSDGATALGAAILAGVGVGAYDSFAEAVKKTVRITRRHQPGGGNACYQRGYEKYLKLYQQLKGLMNEEEGAEV
jgi:xylulokinase